MRILSGSVRGKKLLPPDDLPLRPTSNKVRAAIFNIIRFQIPGSLFLDLFAGTGAVGLNALSEGASSVTFVEKNWRCIHAIKKNLSLSCFESKARIIKEPVERFIQWESLEKYHFIFLDPPYDYKCKQYSDLLGAMHSKLKKTTLIIMEHISKNDFSIIAAKIGYDYQEKHYGKIKLSMFRTHEN